MSAERMIAIVALVCVLVDFCRSQAPPLIPIRADGYAFKRGRPDSDIVVSIFFDLTCTDTAAVWDVLNEVTGLYENEVYFLYHLTALPFLQQAFICAKTAALVKYYTQNEESVFIYADNVFWNQARVLNGATADLSFNEVVSLVSEFALANGTGLTEAQYAEGWNRSTSAGAEIEGIARNVCYISMCMHAAHFPSLRLHG
jgi:hypothetical protein